MEKTKYNYDAKDDKDIKSTLKSAKLAEDFYGYSHPNRFSGEFNSDGEYICKGEHCGKGKEAGNGYNNYYAGAEANDGSEDRSPQNPNGYNGGDNYY